MKTSKDDLITSSAKIAALGLLLALVCLSVVAQPSPARTPPMPGMPPRFAGPGQPPLSSNPELTNAPSNYLVRVEWKEMNSPSAALEVLTGEGTFQVNTSLSASAKSGEPMPSTPVTLNGMLKVLNEDQGRLELFLGRSIAYSTTGPGQTSSIQQRQDGLTVTFYVTFGKPVMVRRDANGEITVLIKKQAP